MATTSAPRSLAERNIIVQRLVNELARRGRGRPADDLQRRLTAVLREASLPPMPPTWVRAVAESAAQGNAYVLTPLTADYVDVPEPAEEKTSYGVA